MLHDEDLDAEGTKLWNVCTRVGRENPARTSEGLKLVIWSRVLAFHILHLCQWSTKCTTPVASHLMELALRVAKLCIGPQPSISLLWCKADLIYTMQKMTTSKTQGSFCRKRLTIMADYIICRQRWIRKMPIRLQRWRQNGQYCALPWCVPLAIITRSRD